MGVRQRLGRRGAYLLLKSGVVLFYGIALLPAQTVSRSARDSLHVAISVMSLHTWAFVWIACGVTGVVSAFSRRSGRLGFAALWAIASFWSINYFIGWALYPPSRTARPWVGGALFAFLAGATYVVSGWDEPGPLLRVGRRASDRP